MKLYPGTWSRLFRMRVLNKFYVILLVYLYNYVCNINCIFGPSTFFKRLHVLMIGFLLVFNEYLLSSAKSRHALIYYEINYLHISGVIPTVVVGVVGIGHVPGIKTNWDELKYDISEIMK